MVLGSGKLTSMANRVPRRNQGVVVSPADGHAADVHFHATFVKQKRKKENLNIPLFLPGGSTLSPAAPREQLFQPEWHLPFGPG